jgi:hypothetical protein
MKHLPIFLLSIFVLLCQPVSLPAVVTQLPAEGLEHLTPSQLYPYWDQFYFSSPTFREAWDRANRIPRQGAETEWNSITDSTLMSAQAYRHLLEDDGWWLERAPNVTLETYQAIRQFALSIDLNRQARKLFFLVLYTRDLGWALTGQGQFHQQTSAPIVATILRELGYDDRWVQLCEEWVANHSVPAETHLGEVSPQTIERLIARFGEVEEVPLLPMVALLSLLEVNCIRYRESAVNEANADVIERFGRGDGVLADEIRGTRLYRLASAGLLRSRASERQRQEIALETQVRFQQLHSLVGDDEEVLLFLEKIDLHYIAATFPGMSPEGVVLFLKRSAEVSLDEEGCRHVINMDQSASHELDRRIVQEELAPTFDQERRWVIWQ